MPAASQFASILKGSPASQVHFVLGGLLVTPRGFSDIGDEILADRIHIRRARDMPAGVDALYNVSSNTLFLRAYTPALFSRSQMRGVLVHEAVHAMIDRNRASGTTLLNGEVAAFLAQTLYRVLSPGDDIVFQSRSSSSTQDGAIFCAALDLIDRFHLRSGLAHISLEAAAPLRNSIHAHSQYSSVSDTELHGADGLGAESWW